MTRRRVSSLLTFLFGGAYIAMLFDYSDIIVDVAHNELWAGKCGYDLIVNLINSFKEGFIFGVDTTFVPILVAVCAAFAAITVLFGFIGLFTRNGGFRLTTVSVYVVIFFELAWLADIMSMLVVVKYLLREKVSITLALMMSFLIPVCLFGTGMFNLTKKEDKKI